MRATIIGLALLWTAGLWTGGLWTAGANAAPVPSVENGSQSIVNFDNVALGTTEFISGAILTRFSGGTIVEGTAANPAFSGTQVYGGTSILVTVGPAQQDLIDYSWPDIGAFVTGTAVVTLRLSGYNYDTEMEELVLTRFSPVGALHFYLSGGATDEFPGYYTSALFTSDEYFTIDTLKLGLPNVAPGIPEPASWALLIGGFALTGARLRTRRVVA